MSSDKGGYCHAGSGKSMARLLYSFLVCSFCVAMLYLAVRHGIFNAYEATAIATLAGGLAWAWTEGKRQRNKNVTDASKESGTQDQAGGGGA